MLRVSSEPWVYTDRPLTSINRDILSIEIRETFISPITTYIINFPPLLNRLHINVTFRNTNNDNKYLVCLFITHTNLVSYKTTNRLQVMSLASNYIHCINNKVHKTNTKGLGKVEITSKINRLSISKNNVCKFKIKNTVWALNTSFNTFLVMPRCHESLLLVSHHLSYRSKFSRVITYTHNSITNDTQAFCMPRSLRGLKLARISRLVTHEK